MGGQKDHLRRRDRLDLFQEFNTHTWSADARTGGGYGRLGDPSGAGTQTHADASFPYVTPLQSALDCVEDPECDDPHDGTIDPDIDLGLAHRVQNAVGATSSQDPYGARRARVDRGSFAHSSMRGLGEMTSTGRSISPIPDLYYGRDMSVGGQSNPVHPHDVRTTGSKKGWTSPPPPIVTDDEEYVDTLWDIETPDERALSRAKREHEHMVETYGRMIYGITNRSR